MAIVSSKTTYQTTHACDGKPGGRLCDTEPVTVVNHVWPEGWKQYRVIAGTGVNTDHWEKIKQYGIGSSWTTAEAQLMLCPVCSGIFDDFVPHSGDKQKRRRR